MINSAEDKGKKNRQGTGSQGTIGKEVPLARVSNKINSKLYLPTTIRELSMTLDTNLEIL